MRREDQRAAAGDVQPPEMRQSRGRTTGTRDDYPAKGRNKVGNKNKMIKRRKKERKK